MPYLIGTDEAGYGPNLGPLVITATVWHVDGGCGDRDLPAALDLAECKANCSPLEFGDSKQLYKSGGTLAKLERGVLAAIGCLPRLLPATWRELLQFVDAACLAEVADVPWYVDYDRPLPTEIAASDAAAASRQLRSALAASGSQLLDIRSRVLFPGAFNQYVQRCGSKGEALSEWTLQLVQEVMKPLEEHPVFVRCDKHGGRKRYAAVLQHIFSDQLIQVVHESRTDSAYQWQRASQNVEIRFTAKGERFLPAALASMVSKYLRELAMAAFNQFWADRIPGLKPTAGYPVDARRFLNAIADQKRKLGVTDHALWRHR